MMHFICYIFVCYILILLIIVTIQDNHWLHIFKIHMTQDMLCVDKCGRGTIGDIHMYTNPREQAKSNNIQYTYIYINT